jgi:hypothetical protein
MAKNVAGIMTLPLLPHRLQLAIWHHTYYEEMAPSADQTPGQATRPWLSNHSGQRWRYSGGCLAMDALCLSGGIAALQSLPQDVWRARRWRISGSCCRITLPLLQPALWLVLLCAARIV